MSGLKFQRAIAFSYAFALTLTVLQSNSVGFVSYAEISRRITCCGGQTNRLELKNRSKRRSRDSLSSDVGVAITSSAFIPVRITWKPHVSTFNRGTAAAPRFLKTFIADVSNIILCNKLFFDSNAHDLGARVTARFAECA